MLLAVKFFEIFTKHKGYCFVAESFVSPIVMEAKTKFYTWSCKIN